MNQISQIRVNQNCVTFWKSGKFMINNVSKHYVPDRQVRYIFPNVAAIRIPWRQFVCSFCRWIKITVIGLFVSEINAIKSTNGSVESCHSGGFCSRPWYPALQICMRRSACQLANHFCWLWLCWQPDARYFRCTSQYDSQAFTRIIFDTGCHMREHKIV